MDNEVLVLIPIFNEKIDVVKGILCRLTDYKVLLINDGSKEELNYSELGLFDNVNIIKYDQNRGQGFAVLYGLNWAFKHEYSLFVTIDGDGQHDVDDMKRMVSFFKSSKYDIVLGSRFLKNNNPGLTSLRRFILKGGVWINYLYSGLLLSDAHCGLKVFNIKFAKELYFMNYRQAHASDFNHIIKSNEFKFCEFPVNVVYTDYSINKGQSNTNAIWIFFVLLKNIIIRSFVNRNILIAKCQEDIKKA